MKQTSSKSRLPPRIRPTMLTEAVLDTGGGPGKTRLDFNTLHTGQYNMFLRTIEKESTFQIACREQEERQLTVDDKPVVIVVNVAREDFPEISADIEFTYNKSASQQAWDAFLKLVCVKLKIEFIHSVLDRSDKSPVFRILRLRQRGEYLIRQRESSAILEVLNTGVNPAELSWAVTADINHIQRELAFDLKTLPAMERRVERLVNKPLTRDREIEVRAQILAASTPEQAISAIENFHTCFLNGDKAPILTEDQEQAALIGFQVQRDCDFSQTDVYKGAVDIISLHRMVLESLSRFVANGGSIAAQHIVRFNLKHILKVLEALRAEVDVAVLGLKLLSDLSRQLTSNRDRVFHVVLDCIQAYAPPAPAHRPRNPSRLKPVGQTDEMAAFGGMFAPPGNKGLDFQVTEISAAGSVEMRRYGDFYGHSAVTSVGDDNKGSGMAEILLEKEAENAGIVIPEETEDEEEGTECEDGTLVGSGTRINGASGTADESRANGQVQKGNKPAEVKAIIRGRGRVDHSTASKALSSAYTTDGTTAADGEATPAVANEPEDIMPYEVVSLVKRNTSSPSPARYTYRVKDRPIDDGTKRAWKGSSGVIGRRAVRKEVEVTIDFKKKAADVVDPFADEVDLPRETTVAVVTTTETAVLPGGAGDGGKLTTRPHPSGDGGRNGRSGTPTNAVTSSEVVAKPKDADSAFNKAKAKRKTRKPKLELKPLPLVPCIVFKGFSGRMKQNIALTQSFATLFRMISENFGNRDAAFKMGVVDEICDVALVCQSQPRILEYVIWTVDAMYQEGFGEIQEVPVDDLVLATAEGEAAEDYSMQITVSISADVANRSKTRNRLENGNRERDSVDGGGGGGDNNDDDGDSRSLGTMENEVIETISELSLPEVDEDGDNRSEATPVVNLGDFSKDYVAEEVERVAQAQRDRLQRERDEAVAALRQAQAEARFYRGTGSSAPVAKPPTPVATTTDPAGEADGGEGADDKKCDEDVTNIAVGNNNKAPGKAGRKPSAIMRRVPNQDVVKVIGLAAFEARYAKRPADIVVLALSLIANHHEISGREQQMAMRWLDTWDDCSREYSLLKRKGMDLCGV